MPMRDPAKVRLSPYAVNTVGSMIPAGGTMKAITISSMPNTTRIKANMT